MIKRVKNWCNEYGVKPIDIIGSFTLIGVIAEFWILAYTLGAR